MQLRIDFSALSFSDPAVQTGWNSVFKGKAIIQSNKQRSKATTS